MVRVQIWRNLGQFGARPNSALQIRFRLRSPNRVCPNLVLQIWFSKFGSPNLVPNSVQFGVCPDLVVVQFGVCPDLVGVQIWLLVGSLAKLLCGASVPVDWLGSDFLSALAGREPQLSSGAAASGFFLLNAERRRSHRWKGTPSFGNCLAQSRRTRPVSSSLSDCRKSGDALDVIRLREHVEWLDLFTPILVFFEPQKVADQRFGITGNVHDAPRSQPHDS